MKCQILFFFVFFLFVFFFFFFFGGRGGSGGRGNTNDLLSAEFSKKLVKVHQVIIKSPRIESSGLFNTKPNLTAFGKKGLKRDQASCPHILRRTFLFAYGNIRYYRTY